MTTIIFFPDPRRVPLHVLRKCISQKFRRQRTLLALCDRKCEILKYQQTYFDQRGSASYKAGRRIIKLSLKDFELSEMSSSFR